MCEGVPFIIPSPNSFILTDCVLTNPRRKLLTGKSLFELAYVSAGVEERWDLRPDIDSCAADSSKSRYVGVR